MGGETGGPDNGVGRATQDSAGQVVQLPRDWFGPREELVPFGPHARVGVEAAPASGSDFETQAAGDNPTRAPLAMDFWGGVAAIEDLVPFPARSAEGTSSERDLADSGSMETVSVATETASRPVRFTRQRALARVRLPRGRLPAAAVAVLFFGLIAGRALTQHVSGRLAGTSAHQLARRGDSFTTVHAFRRSGSLDARDEPRTLGVRRLASPARGRERSRPHRARERHATGSGAANATDSGAATRPRSGQPVAYSPGAAVPSSSTVSSSSAAASSNTGAGGDGGSSGAGSTGSTSGGSGSTGSGSGGSGSTGSGSSKPGPTGPGAPFGPGTLGK